MTDDPRDNVRARFAEAETIGPSGNEPPPPQDEGSIDPVEGAVHPQNDLGNARRMVTYFGRDLLFVPRVGWFVWSGKHWQIDPSKVMIVNLNPAEIAAAWRRGDIDGAFVWSPALGEIKKSGKVLTDAAEVGQ